MKLIKKINLLLLIMPLLAYSQNIQYARYIIDTLASPYLCGRYYINNSDLKAAKFIVSELKKDYIKPFTNDFFQYFIIPSVNIFPQTPVVKINNKQLNAGSDYILAGYSGSLKGTFYIKKLRKKHFKHKIKTFPNKFLYIPIKFFKNQKNAKKLWELIYNNAFKVKGYIVETDKMMFIPSMEHKNFVVIIVKKGILKKIKKISVNIQSQLIKNYKTQNIAAYLKGEKDTFIVLTAHYDHIGCLGKNAVFTGAHDNASGVAMLLDFAKELSNRKCKPKYSIAFIFFSGEELGLLGSYYYVYHPLFPLNKIKFLINLDLMGTGDEGVQVVNSTIYKKQYQMLQNINNKYHLLPQIKKRGAARNSDHYPFYEKGVPDFFFYTLGKYKQIHNIYDTRENIPLSAYNNVYRLIDNFIKQLENN